MKWRLFYPIVTQPWKIPIKPRSGELSDSPINVSVWMPLARENRTQSPTKESVSTTWTFSRGHRGPNEDGRSSKDPECLQHWVLIKCDRTQRYYTLMCQRSECSWVQHEFLRQSHWQQRGLSDNSTEVQMWKGYKRASTAHCPIPGLLQLNCLPFTLPHLVFCWKIPEGWDWGRAPLWANLILLS